MSLDAQIKKEAKAVKDAKQNCSKAQADDEITIKTLCCDQCGIQAPAGGAALMVCSRCLSVHYCGKNCQTYAWKRHKKECQSLSKARILASETDRKHREIALPSSLPDVPINS